MTPDETIIAKMKLFAGYCWFLSIFGEHELSAL